MAAAMKQVADNPDDLIPGLCGAVQSVHVDRYRTQQQYSLLHVGIAAAAEQSHGVPEQA